VSKERNTLQSQVHGIEGGDQQKTTLRNLVIQAGKTGATLPNGQPIKILLEDPDNASVLDTSVVASDCALQDLLRLFPVPKRLLAILSWGPRAQYREVPSSITVGELKREVEADVSRLQGGKVHKYVLQVTGNRIRPDEETRLLSLTNYPHANICLDVLNEGEPLLNSELRSVNEHLFRKHLARGRFQSGVDQGLWRLLSISWPEIFIALRQKEHRGRCEEALVRLGLKSYPQRAPIVQLWDGDRLTKVEPEDWPRWFADFVMEHYGSFGVIEAASYSRKLLQISETVARRLKQEEVSAWDSSGDITQSLIRLLTCLRRESRASQGSQRGRRRFTRS